MSGLYDKTSTQLRELSDCAWDFCAPKKDLTGFDKAHKIHLIRKTHGRVKFTCRICLRVTRVTCRGVAGKLMRSAFPKR